ncbi:MAG: hypothetical protein ACQEQM_07310 [Thermoplasmatota archaeon]
MKRKDETEKTLGVKLKVKKSSVRFEGSIRVHDSILEKLGCDEKDQIVLMNDEEKKILNTIYADELVAKDTVILRAEAMDDLDVKEGDEVTLQVNKKIIEELKNKAGGFKEDVKEQSGDFKDSVKDKFSNDEDKEE